MNLKGEVFKSRTLLLLAENPGLAGQLEQALAIYQLNHNLRSFKDLTDYQNHMLLRQASLETEVDDLLLLAYPHDVERTNLLLKDIRNTPRWRLVPVVVFLDNRQMEAAKLSYHYGANSVLPFPLGFEAIRNIVNIMDHYWFNVVSLPSDINDD